jgi:hypothetical protein
MHSNEGKGLLSYGISGVYRMRVPPPFIAEEKQRIEDFDSPTAFERPVLAPAGHPEGNGRSLQVAIVANTLIGVFQRHWRHQKCVFV